MAAGLTGTATTGTATDQPLVIAVVGPTASGKSDLAVAIARATRLGAEIVNADSMQLYIGMDVGTAKLPVSERAGIEHHLLDVWPISKSAAVAEYQALARARISEIHGRGRVPILVGGSGLYLRAALDHLDFPGESPAVRAALERELAAVGPAELHHRLTRVDPAAAAAILPSNGRRIVRALEVIDITGGPFLARMPGFESFFNTIQIGLERDDLDERVGRRVETMIETGLVEEVARLLPAGLRTSPTAGKALGYAQVLDVLSDDGDVVGDLAEAIEITKRATRRFVRRQRSWFRRDPRIIWLDGTSPGVLDRALAVLPPTLVG